MLFHLALSGRSSSGYYMGELHNLVGHQLPLHLMLRWGCGAARAHRN
jgi:hypothetical protein